MEGQEFIKSLLTSDSKDKILYLAQHNIFTQIPDLLHDIITPDYCHCSELESESESEDFDMENHVKINGWIGPSNTISPLHTDPHHNIFAQIVGRKYIRLYDPKWSNYLYPFGDESLMTNTSQVSIETPDSKLFPLFSTAIFSDCIVGPGDLLFIPRGWWHYVRSLEVSCSVSFWF
jgi:hypothetical protein